VLRVRQLPSAHSQISPARVITGDRTHGKALLTRLGKARCRLLVVGVGTGYRRRRGSELFDLSERKGRQD
jgi:hypothetical protein